MHIHMYDYIYMNIHWTKSWAGITEGESILVNKYMGTCTILRSIREIEITNTETFYFLLPGLVK